MRGLSTAFCLSLWSHFLAASSRCQRRIVSGVTESYPESQWWSAPAVPSGREHGPSQPGRDADHLSAAKASCRVSLAIPRSGRLELDDLLLAFGEPSAGDGKQNVPGLENELHLKLGRGQETDQLPRHDAQFKRLRYRNACGRNWTAFLTLRARIGSGGSRHAGSLTAMPQSQHPHGRR